MQITELESKGLTKSFKIIVDGAQIDAQMEAELKAAGARVKIPGFRPGYIPMKILKQRYGKSVQGDVLKQVINKTTGDVMREKQLRPALTPQVSIEDFEDGGDLTFTMEFESFPEIPELVFNNITLDRKTFEIEEKRIDETAESILARSPKLNRAEEGAEAQLGQVLAIDFKGMIDGKAFDGGTAHDFRLELGSGQFIEGFEDQLVGAKEDDEHTVKVTFPEDYRATHLAGKEAAFEVKVKEIYTKDLPVFDDEFAKIHGFADANAFREAIRGQLVKEYDQVVRNRLKKQLFDVLEEKYDIELPKGMVDAEFNAIWDRLKQSQSQGEESSGKNDEELQKEYRQIAERRVKLGLLLAEVGTRNKIQISREELSRAVMQQAGQFQGQEKQVLEFYRNHPERVDDLRGPILEEKAVDFILAQVKFNDEKVPVEALVEEDEDTDSTQNAKKPAKAKAAKTNEEKPKKAAAKKKAAGDNK